MSNNALVNHIHEMTDDQMRLIKATVARNATNDELSLFLYRCKHMDLDPLKPGHIHFVKYKDNPGTIIIGIDGFRSKAAKTGKHTGTKRGLILDNAGECRGAWAEVYRSDWQHPAREEVSLAEYNTGRSNWAKMPETMIKKVAEVAALRMAFPDELGGIYSDDEMAQADNEQKVETIPGATEKDVSPELNFVADKKAPEEKPKPKNHAPPSNDLKITQGKFKGKKLSEVPENDIQDYIQEVCAALSSSGKKEPKWFTEIRNAAGF